jgi:hypothetical protein
MRSSRHFSGSVLNFLLDAFLLAQQEDLHVKPRLHIKSNFLGATYFLVISRVN